MRAIAGAIVLAAGAAIGASVLPEPGRLVIGALLVGTGIALLFAGWNQAKPPQ